jgi:hypothetical protein
MWSQCGPVSLPDPKLDPKEETTTLPPGGIVGLSDKWFIDVRGPETALWEVKDKVLSKLSANLP